jgi:hypothetical protein
MKPVSQTIIDSEKGDCFRACLASLLELPIEQVPNNHETKQVQFDFYNDWLRPFNLQLAFIRFGAMPLPQGHFILVVKSACFKNCTHTVIAKENEETCVAEIVWNPNPKDSRGNNIPADEWSYFYVLAVIDPKLAKVKHK